MNLFVLSWSYIKERPLNTFLNVFLLSLGLAIMIVLLLMSHQLKNNLEKNAKGIDLVVGAKGSPLQLILSSIYHVDFPTGNIPLEEARKVAENRRHVKNAVPLALGDSYQNYRIVGTNHSYLDLYQAEVGVGVIWSGNFEVTLGSETASGLGLSVGDEFMGEHGLTTGGQSHDNHAYKVVGVLKPTGTVIDKLIMSNVESVWLMHEKEGDSKHHEEDTSAVASDIFGIKTNDPDDKELTSLLIQYRGPRAALQFPRMVNSNSSLQAASPPFETARLFNLIGVGVDILKGFAYVILFVAGLSVFIALYNSLKARKYDLAIMRSMGASPNKLLLMIILEGVIITLLGGLLGLFLGHGLVELMGLVMATSNQTIVTGLIFLNEEFLIGLVSLVLGIFASIIPAIEAYRTDISQVLAKG